MAYREKAAWVSLVSTILVWGGYFLMVARQIAGGRPDGDAILERFVSAVVLSIVLAIVTATVLALMSRGEDEAPADERERLIELKSTSAAYGVLSLGALAVALSAPVVAVGALRLFPGDPASDTALITANGVLLSLIVAELVRSGGQILRYRLGR